MLVILAQGARFPDDLGCSRIRRVFYAGFDIPELDSFGQPNWIFHKGTVTSRPVYVPIDSVDIATNEIVSTAHPYITGDPIAFHTRGNDAAPDTAGGLLQTHHEYMVWKTSNDRYYVLAQTSGAPDAGNAIDFTAEGADTDRLFSYKADAFYFDPDQGRPTFFPTIPFTFAGLTYIEVKIPEPLANGEDEPTNLKVVMEGKEMYQIEVNGNSIQFTSEITAEPNNALVAADALVHDQQLPLTRLGRTFVDWRDRCDTIIEWIGGADTPAFVNNFPTMVDVDLDISLRRLTKTGPTNAYDAYAVTDQFEDVDFSSLEVKFGGSNFSLSFCLNNTHEQTNRQGVRVSNNTVYYLYDNTVTEITPIGASDFIKIAYEGGVFVIYKNSIPMPMVDNTYTQRYRTFYIEVELWSSLGFISELLITPSGTNTNPRQLERFRGHYSASQPVPVIDLFETMIHFSPGSSWASFDGLIQIAPEPDREPCFTFIYDPDDPNSNSNISKVRVKRKPITSLYNYFRFSFRDEFDTILTKKYDAIDRPALRALNDNRLNDPGMFTFGVMSQSQAQRIMECRARLESDLDTGFTVEAFLDSIRVCKGSIVWLIDPTGGYPASNPARCLVIDDRLSHRDVEQKSYELQIIVPNFYSDLDHGQVMPPANTSSSESFIPAPIAESLILTETTEPMPDGTVLASVSGEVDFISSIPGQIGQTYRARIFKKPLISLVASISYSTGTDQFTATDPADIPSGSTALSLAFMEGGSMPSGSSHDIPYYAVNISGANFKLSKTIGGPPEIFESNGADLRLFQYVPWIDTGMDVRPNADGVGTFEIIPAQASLFIVRVQTFSRADISLGFEVQKTAVLFVIGEVDPPMAPFAMMADYDGLNLRLELEPSPTIGVSAYMITDEADRPIGVMSAKNSFFAEALADAESVTRRAYAVGSSGVLSASFAEVTFEKSKAGEWIIDSGLTINPDNTLLKIAGTGWDNAGAILDQAVLTDEVPAKLRMAPDRTDIRQVMGFSYISNVNGLTDIEFGIIFNEDATVEAYFDNGAEQDDLGTYQSGDEFILNVIPPVSIGEVSNIRVYKKAFGSAMESFLYAFNADISRKMVLYAGVAIYTSGAISNLIPRLSGDLVPALGLIPDGADSIVNAAYNASIGQITSTGGTGWGSAGLSISVDPIRSGFDGGYRFSGTGFFAIGLSQIDTDLTADSIGYHIRIYDDFSAEIYAGSTLLETGLTVGASDLIFVSRENGIPTIRKNGIRIHIYTAASTALKENALILDIAFDHSIANSTIDLKSFQSKKTVVTSKPTVAVGGSKAGAIPEFNAHGMKLKDKDDGLFYWVELDTGVLTITPA